MKNLNTIIGALCMLISFVSCNNSDDIDVSIKVSNILPLTANVGETITINGFNFDPNETYIVQFNDKEGTIIELTSTYIKVQVPEKSYTGKVTITYNQGKVVAGNVTIINIFEDEVVLTTQKEVDDFGANNYSEITEGLKISGEYVTTQDPIKNINALKALTKVDRHLSIIKNDNLSDVNGLANLQEVDGLMIIDRNNIIRNLDSLSNLTTTKGFNINSNTLLESITGLKNLTEVEYLYCVKNESLTSLNGLQNLKTIESLKIERSALENLDGLEGITELSYGVVIYVNDKLLNINGLKNLTYLGEEDDSEIASNKLLTNIDGLANLTEIDSELDIYSNESLTNLDGLSSLTKFDNGALDVFNNIKLSNFCSLTNFFKANNHTHFSVYGNAYNPTIQDIIDGKCSQ